MPKPLLIGFLIGCLVTAVRAQTGAPLKHLHQQLRTLQDSARVDGLNDLSYAYTLSQQKDSALYFAHRALQEARGLGYTHGMAVAYARYSRIAKHFEDNFKQSEALGKEALQWFARTPNKSGIDTLYDQLAYAVFAQSRFEEAVDYVDRKYQWARQKNEHTARYDALTWKASIYREAGDFENSFYCARQCYQLAVEEKNEIWLSNTLFLLGELYMKMDDHPTALNYFRQAFAMDNPAMEKQRANNDWDIWVKMEFAEVFSHLRQFDSAWHYYRLYRPPSENHVYYRVYLVSTGECYMLQGNYQRALEALLPALQYHREVHDRNEVMRALIDIAKTYLALSNDSAALRYAREGLAMARQTNARHRIRDGYGVLYSVYDHRGQQDSSNHFFRQYAAAKDTLASDQTKARFAAFRYEQQIALLNKNRQLQQQRLQQTAQQRTFLVISLAGLLVLGFFLLRNISLKRKNEAHRRALAENELQLQKLEHEKGQAALQQQATELQMQALRAQMNPHFIFNCLNSINHFIMSNDAQAASDYLTRFSRLIRMVLTHSQYKLIALQDELDCLELYIQMEQLRFHHRFTYSIHCEEAIDPEEVPVPPLLLQPFVENAILHGLTPLKSNGMLSIHIDQQNGLMRCRIRDNGVGRRQAAEASHDPKKTSLGLQLTRERMELLGNKDQAAFSITDLQDGEGSALGTEVVITIPVTAPVETILQ